MGNDRAENPHLFRAHYFVDDGDQEMLRSDITLRDLFAGMAMQGLCADGDGMRSVYKSCGTDIEAACFANAMRSYELAEAMLKVRGLSDD